MDFWLLRRNDLDDIPSPRAVPSLYLPNFDHSNRSCNVKQPRSSSAEIVTCWRVFAEPTRKELKNDVRRWGSCLQQYDLRLNANRSENIQLFSTQAARNGDESLRGIPTNELRLKLERGSKRSQRTSQQDVVEMAEIFWSPVRPEDFVETDTENWLHYNLLNIAYGSECCLMTKKDEARVSECNRIRNKIIGV